MYVNNQEGDSDITFDQIGFVEKGLETDVEKVAFANNPGSDAVTDLIIDTLTNNSTNPDAVDFFTFIEQQILYIDRYQDQTLIDTIEALSGTDKHEITIGEKTPFMTFVSDGETSAYTQLKNYLIETGLSYKLDYDLNLNPDPDKYGILYGLNGITLDGVNLDFRASYTEYPVFTDHLSTQILSVDTSGADHTFAVKGDISALASGDNASVPGTFRFISQKDFNIDAVNFDSTNTILTLDADITGLITNGYRINGILIDDFNTTNNTLTLVGDVTSRFAVNDTVNLTIEETKDVTAITYESSTNKSTVTVDGAILDSSYVDQQFVAGELIKETFKDLDGIMLLSTQDLNVQLQAGYITEVLYPNGTDEDIFNAIGYGASPTRNVFFTTFEEVDLNLNATTASTFDMDNSNFDGILTVTGSDQADTFDLDVVSGTTILYGGAGDDQFNIGAAASSVNTITEDLYIYGQDGTDSINVDDSSEVEDQDVTLTRNVVEEMVSLERIIQMTNVLELSDLEEAENIEVVSNLRKDAIDALEIALGFFDSTEQESDLIDDSILRITVDKIADIKLELEDILVDFEDIKDEIENNDDPVLNSEISNLVDLYQAAYGQWKAVFDSLEEIIGEKDSLSPNVATSDLDTLGSELSTLLLTLTSIQTDLSTKVAALAALEATLDTKQTELDTLQSQLATIKSTSTSLDDQFQLITQGVPDTDDGLLEELIQLQDDALDALGDPSSPATGTVNELIDLLEAYSHPSVTDVSSFDDEVRHASTGLVKLKSDLSSALSSLNSATVTLTSGNHTWTSAISEMKDIIASEFFTTSTSVEVQELSISGISSSYFLQYGSDFTVELAKAASAATVQSAIDSIVSGVTVSKSGNTLTFRGSDSTDLSTFQLHDSSTTLVTDEDTQGDGSDNEIQSLNLTTYSNGDKFRLIYNSVLSDEITYSSAAATNITNITAALTAFGLEVTVTESSEDFTFTYTDAGKANIANVEAWKPGAPTDATVVQLAGKEQITFDSTPTSGNFNLSLNGGSQTGNLSSSSTASAIDTALGGTVSSVVETTNGVFDIVFSDTGNEITIHNFTSSEYTAFTNIETALVALDDANDDLEAAAVLLNERLVLVADKNAEIRTALDSIISKNNSIETNLADITAELESIADNQDLIDAIQTSLLERFSQINGYMNELETLYTTVESLVDEMETAQKEISDSTSTTVRGKLEARLTLIETAYEELETLHQQMEAYNEDLAELNLSARKVPNLNELAQDENLNLAFDRTYIKNIVTDVDEQIDFTNAEAGDMVYIQIISESIIDELTWGVGTVTVNSGSFQNNTTNHAIVTFIGVDEIEVDFVDESNVPTQLGLISDNITNEIDATIVTANTLSDSIDTKKTELNLLIQGDPLDSGDLFDPLETLESNVDAKAVFIEHLEEEISNALTDITAARNNITALQNNGLDDVHKFDFSSFGGGSYSLSYDGNSTTVSSTSAADLASALDALIAASSDTSSTYEIHDFNGDLYVFFDYDQAYGTLTTPSSVAITTQSITALETLSTSATSAISTSQSTITSEKTANETLEGEIATLVTSVSGTDGLLDELDDLLDGTASGLTTTDTLVQLEADVDTAISDIGTAEGTLDDSGTDPFTVYDNLSSKSSDADAVAVINFLKTTKTNAKSLNNSYNPDAVATAAATLNSNLTGEINALDGWMPLGRDVLDQQVVLAGEYSEVTTKHGEITTALTNLETRLYGSSQMLGKHDELITKVNELYTQAYTTIYLGEYDGNTGITETLHTLKDAYYNIYEKHLDFVDVLDNNDGTGALQLNESLVNIYTAESAVDGLSGLKETRDDLADITANTVNTLSDVFINYEDGGQSIDLLLSLKPKVSADDIENALLALQTAADDLENADKTNYSTRLDEFLTKLLDAQTTVNPTKVSNSAVTEEFQVKAIEFYDRLKFTEETEIFASFESYYEDLPASLMTAFLDDKTYANAYDMYQTPALPDYDFDEFKSTISTISTLTRTLLVETGNIDNSFDYSILFDAKAALEEFETIVAFLGDETIDATNFFADIKADYETRQDQLNNIYDDDFVTDKTEQGAYREILDIIDGEKSDIEETLSVNSWNYYLLGEALDLVSAYLAELNGDITDYNENIALLTDLQTALTNQATAGADALSQANSTLSNLLSAYSSTVNAINNTSNIVSTAGNGYYVTVKGTTKINLLFTTLTFTDYFSHKINVNTSTAQTHLANAYTDLNTGINNLISAFVDLSTGNYDLIDGALTKLNTSISNFNNALTDAQSAVSSAESAFESTANADSQVNAIGGYTSVKRVSGVPQLNTGTFSTQVSTATTGLTDVTNNYMPDAVTKKDTYLNSSTAVDTAYTAYQNGFNGDQTLSSDYSNLDEILSNQTVLRDNKLVEQSTYLDYEADLTTRFNQAAIDYSESLEIRNDLTGSELSGTEIKALVDARIAAAQGSFDVESDKVTLQYAFLKLFSSRVLDTISSTRTSASEIESIASGNLTTELQTYSRSFSTVDELRSSLTDSDDSQFGDKISGSSVAINSDVVSYSDVLTLSGVSLANIHVGWDDIENLTVSIGSGEDTVLISDTLDDTTDTVTINTNGGDDEISVHNVLGDGNDSILDTDDDEYSLDGITSALEIYAGDDSNFLRILDHGDDDVDVDIIHNTSGDSSTLTGLSIGDILYQSSGTFDKGFENLEDDSLTEYGIELRGSSSLGNTWTINSTLKDSITNIYSGTGADTVTINDLSEGESGGIFNLYAQTGSDSIQVNMIHGDTTIHGNEGEDTITLGTNGSDYADLFGDFRIYGDEENDTINIYAENENTATSGSDIDALIEGNAGDDTINVFDHLLNKLSIFGNDGDDEVNISTNSSIIDIHGDIGNDDINILDNAVGGTLNIEGNDGDDDIFILDASGALNIEGNAGADEIFATYYDATAVIHTNDDNDRVYLGDVAGLTTLYTEGGDDEIYIRRNTAVINIFTGSGDDYIEIGASASWGIDLDDVSNLTFIVGDDGNLDNILANIFLEGGAHPVGDRLNINDSANTADRDYVIVNNTFSDQDVVDFGTTGSLTYKEIEAVDYNMGTGDDKVAIKSTDASMVTTLNGNAGDDTFTFGDDGNVMGNINGLVNVHGDDGFDIINLINSGAQTADGRISNTQIDGFGLGDMIRYFSSDLINVLLGSSDDTLNVAGLFTATALAVNGGTGSNARKALHVDAGDGSDTINIGADASNTSGLLNGEDGNIGTNEIWGDVVVNAGAGAFDTLNILERNETADHSAIRYLGAKTYNDISDARVMTGTDVDAQGYIVGLDGREDTDLDHQAIAHLGFEELNMILGAGDDTVSVEVSDTTEVNTDLLGAAHQPRPGQDNTNIFTGAGDDELFLSDEQYIRGSFDGEEGVDTLNYSRWTTSALVNLQTGKATGFNSGYDDGVFNLENLVGGSANDFLYGNDLDNIIIGGEGHDILYGFAGMDELYGNEGDDKLFAGSGSDKLFGHEGDDLLNGGADGDFLDGGEGSDEYQGGTGDDHFYIIDPALDTDEIAVEADTVRDTSGVDTLDFSGWAFSPDGEGVGINLTENGVNVIHTKTLSELNIDGVFENVIGTEFDDHIIGNDAPNIIDGRSGVDKINGQKGDDILYGGPGADDITSVNNANENDTVYPDGRWDGPVFGSDSGQTGTEYMPPVLTPVDTTDFGNDVDTALASYTGTVVSVNPNNANQTDYIYKAGGTDTDILITVNPSNSNRLYIVEVNPDGSIYKVTDVSGNYDTVRVETSTKEDDKSNPVNRTTRVEDISSTGIDLTVKLNGQINTFDSSSTSHAVTVIGSDGKDYIKTGSANDNINSGGGDDEIDAGAGNDIVDAGAGNDIVYGREGDDEIRGADGEDEIFGGLGSDRLVGGLGNDILYGNEGDDFIFGDGLVVFNTDANNELLKRTDGSWDFTVSDLPGGGDDILIGNTGDDYLDGNRGNDLLFGDDVVLFTEDVDEDGYIDFNVIDNQPDTPADETDGNDQLYGHEGDDKIFGSSGRDLVDAGIGNDYLDAGTGNDYVRAASGKNIAIGWEGDDDILAYNLETMIYGGFGNDNILADVVNNPQNIDAGPGDDKVEDYDFTDQLSIYTVNLIDQNDPGILKYVIEWGDGTATILDMTDRTKSGLYLIDSGGGYNDPTPKLDETLDFGFIYHKYENANVIIQPVLKYVRASGVDDQGPLPIINANIAPELSTKGAVAKQYFNDPVVLDATAFDIGLNEDLLFEWDMGDGTVYNTAKVTHLYEKVGTYRITLTVTDADGDQIVFTDTITLYADPANPWSPPKPPKGKEIKKVETYNPASIPIDRGTTNLFSRISSLDINGDGVFDESELNRLQFIKLVPEEIDEDFLFLFSEEAGEIEKETKEAKKPEGVDDESTNIENEDVEAKAKEEEEKKKKEEEKPLSFFKRSIQALASVFYKA